MKTNRRVTNCVVEVAPSVQKKLFNNGRVYLRYSACKFADHIRVLQCYRCLMFGHIVENCKAMPSCGHCASQHEMKNCGNRDRPPVCGNCSRNTKTHPKNTAHSATDAKKCPILSSKLKD